MNDNGGRSGSEHKQRIRGYATVTTAQPIGADAALITVEADVTRGLHSFSVVGLADRAVEESRDRIAAAIRHAGFKSPKSENKRIVLSLSPADIKKEGSHYDVPLAICYLIAVEEIPSIINKALCTGELALDGTIRPVHGVLAQVRAAYTRGITTAFVPLGNAAEASLVNGLSVYAPKNLSELIKHIRGEVLLPKYSAVKQNTPPPTTDLSAIKGQESARRALEIAAAGRHNIVLYGPPGTGKTLLAKALPSILPPLTTDEVLEVTTIHSTAGILNPGTVIYWPPFRAPHHTASYTAMVGGGVFPRAGEMTLAHKGVLFLDEFTEFGIQTIEALRQPLEDKRITISRTKATITFPADCMVIAAMNPAETVTNDAMLAVRTAQKQARKISRPIADRFDMWVEVPPVPHETLAALQKGELSISVRKRVIAARNFSQKCRDKARNEKNVLFEKDEELILRCTDETRETLVQAAKKLKLSARGYYRTLRLAQTIANMEQSLKITPAHIFEALQYRPRGMLGMY